MPHKTITAHNGSNIISSTPNCVNMLLNKKILNKQTATSANIALVTLLLVTSKIDLRERIIGKSILDCLFILITFSIDIANYFFAPLFINIASSPYILCFNNDKINLNLLSPVIFVCFNIALTFGLLPIYFNSFFLCL